jgi:hypothetical protein
MKYLHFTNVDAVTGISIAAEPAQNGPVFPAVLGLQFEWARESQYPTAVPDLFGTCPDDSDIVIDGVIAEVSQTDYEQMKTDEMSRRPTERDVAKTLRTASVAAITVTVNGKIFDGDETSQTRMARAIIGMQATSTPTLTWVLHDNTVTEATVAELTEALVLAGQAQSDVWVL